jgi:DNA-binding MarR family transcriptional regulator
MTDQMADKQKLDYESSLEDEARPELRVWLRLLTCSTMIEQHVRTGLRQKFETTLPRFDILAQLDRAADDMTMGQLSSQLMVSNGNITGLVDRLVQERLVSRKPAPGDRRTQLVRLTEQGRKVFHEMVPEHGAWVADMMSGLDRDEMNELLRLLGRLKSSVKSATD